MKIKTLTPIPNEFYEILDYPGDSCSDIVVVSQAEVDEYKKAASECFSMIDEATDYVIKKKLYREFGIPKCMEDMIDYSFNHSEDFPHMVGRFDFAGGLDNTPIKMLEFNSDTPFTIVECSAVQYGLTKVHGYNPDINQFNHLFEALEEYFEWLVKRKGSISGAFCSILGKEDDMNMLVIMEAALNHIDAEFVNYHNLGIGKDNGFCAFDSDNKPYKFFNALFKLVPYDALITEDMPMLEAMAELFAKERENITIGNPPYSIIYQSKQLLTLLYQMFPKSPYLLKTYNQPVGSDYVRKPVYGREGQNVSIFLNNQMVETVPSPLGGEYIYQEYAELNKDSLGRRYQAGVFISMEDPCGLIFRRSEPNQYIIDVVSSVCGHIIE